jgi:hypothetical protein
MHRLLCKANKLNLSIPLPIFIRRSAKKLNLFCIANQRENYDLNKVIPVKSRLPIRTFPELVQ